MASTSTVAMAGIVSSTTPATSTGPATSRASSTHLKPALLPIRASSQLPDQCSRRALLSLLATAAPAVLYAKEALAAATSIKVDGPPPPSGGLPGTQNSDQARDTDLPLKERFYFQALSPQDAAVRAKDCAKDIVNVKSLIDKKAWPYVMNDLRLKASYLRFDLNTIIASKNKADKKALRSLVDKLFDEMNNLDYAARNKSPSNAAKYYATTVSSLNDVLAKLG